MKKLTTLGQASTLNLYYDRLHVIRRLNSKKVSHKLHFIFIFFYFIR